MRITGLASGLDVDNVVKETMKAYRIKIDTVGQKKDLVDVKQKLYRDVIADARKFYDKYFDLAKGNNLFSNNSYSTIKYLSSDETVLTAKEATGGFTGKYTADVKSMASAAQITLNVSDFSGKNTIRIAYGDTVKDIDINGLSSEADIAKKINSELSSSGIKAYYSDFAKGIVIETKSTGTSTDKPNKFQVTIGNVDSTLGPPADGEMNPLLNAAIKDSTEGKNAVVSITDSQGRTIDFNDLKNNSVVVDGIEFTFNSVGTASVTGKKDVTELKDKLVEFVKDYNTFIEKLNVLTTEKRDRSYMPLTPDQKKEMSEEEIKLWENKVKSGQLNRDMYLTNMISSMKNSMTSLVSGADVSLDQIGITAVKDYGFKNGTFSIDESKLTKALEENIDSVKSLFISNPSPTDPGTNDEKFAKSGIFTRLKNTIYDTCISTKSTLLDKVGYEGSKTYVNNELTRTMEKYQIQMDKMESDFSRREQALYSQYARLETAMNKYNAQLNSLSQLTGGIS